MTLNQIRALVADDLAAVDRLLSEQSRSEVDLANQVARYIVEAGGKRIRAVLVLLCGRALGGLRHPDASFMLAAVIEFIHTATLLHDDVIDDSEIRRGRATANKVWGNEASVLGGRLLLFTRIRHDLRNRPVRSHSNPRQRSQRNC